MREVLFRAKTVPDYKDIMTGKIIKTPKWIYGYVDLGYMHDCGVPIISDEKGNKAYKCQYESIGQFTGLTDKNGKKIFEGDIVRCKYANVPKNEHIQKVVFEGCKFMAEFSEGGCYSELYDGSTPLTFKRTAYMNEIEVIGNIHDNPELLEV